MLYDLAKQNGLNVDFSNLGIVGVSHKSSSIALREIFSDPRRLYSQLKNIDAEHAVLSTCNRTELIFSSPKKSFQFVKEKLYDSFKGMLPLNLHSRAENFIYSLDNEIAIDHFFKVASGLDSMVLGEAEILGQVKRAYAEAVKSGTVKSDLHRLFQVAFRTAKQVRSTTGIGRGKVSVVSSATLAVKNVFGDLTDRKVLLIGAGETSTLVAQHLKQAGLAQFFISNRSESNAKPLLNLVNGVFVPLDRIQMILPLVDIVIAAVNSDSKMELLSVNDFQRVLKTEARKKYCVVDLSVPRVVEDEVDKISSVYLFNIDGLSSFAEKNKSYRESEAVRALNIISSQVYDYQSWQEKRIINLHIQQLLKHYDSIAEIEKQRLLKRLNGFNDKYGSSVAINNSFSGVSKKLFDPIVRGLKSGEITEVEFKSFLKCLGLYVKRD